MIRGGAPVPAPPPDGDLAPSALAPRRPPSPAARTSSLEHRVPALVLLGGLPAVLVALGWLWGGDVGVELRWTLTVVVLAAWLAAAAAAHARVAHQLRTLANLLGALREGDYSLRGAGDAGDDAYAQAVREANGIGALLQAQRRGAVEASALLRSVLHEIDVVVLVFDEDESLRLVNRAGAALLGDVPERLVGRGAAALGLADALRVVAPHAHGVRLPGREGRWELRRSVVRQDGRTHHLLVLADVSRALRAEERQAWQRLVRVLGHEINNSLAPIKSLARSVERIVERMLGGEPVAAERADEVRNALRVIGGRADGLGRFLQAYARVTQLPPPTPRPTDVAAWASRVAALEPRLAVRVEPGPPAVVHADPDQLDQLLINLVRNAADAALEGGGHVALRWSLDDGLLDLVVEDDGPGIADATNLFVPFFTTKPGGSGVGLALGRQIAEAHDGTLTLESRADGGCRARVRLPMDGGR